MFGTTAPIEGHDYNTGKYCTAAGCMSSHGLPRIHYSCHDCGCDCTAGSNGGPATMDTSGVTRCYQCSEIWSRKRGALSPWTVAEVETIRVALSQIADDGDALPVSALNRKTATEILSRHEGS